MTWRRSQTWRSFYSCHPAGNTHRHNQEAPVNDQDTSGGQARHPTSLWRWRQRDTPCEQLLSRTLSKISRSQTRNV